MCEPIHPSKLGDRKLAYYPNEGEEKESTEFMTCTKPKKKLERPILYLDFETDIQGSKCDCKNLVIEAPTHPGFYPPLLWVMMIRMHLMLMFHAHNSEAPEYKYFQTVIMNYCEIQREREWRMLCV